MDEMRRCSSKRKHPSSSPSRPLLQITTRSNAHLFPHPNRTGHLLSDPARTRDPHYGFQSPDTASRSDSVKYSSDDDDGDMLVISDPCKTAKLSQESSVGDDDQPSRVPIKDLRARRVYSPQSVGGSYSNSSQKVDAQQSRVGSDCRDQKMADSGFGSASTTANSGREGETSERNGELDNLGEGRGKHEINSIMFSIAKEYRSEKANGLYFDDALDTRKEESESPVVGFANRVQNRDHVNHESMDEGQKLQYVSDVNGGRGAFERIGDLNEVRRLTTPPDIEICGNLEVNEGGGKQVEGIHVKDTQLTGNAEENKMEPFCPKADNKNDSVLERKTVLKPRMQRKLFKTPGSVSYRRLLPFLMNMTKDDSGSSIMGHRQNDEKVIDAKQFQFPLSSQSQEALKDRLKKDSCLVHEAVESRALADNSNLSGGNKPKLTSYEELPESATQLRAKEVAHDCSFVPSANERIENVEISLKCSSNTKADLTVDFPCERDVANPVHIDDLKQDSQHSNVNGGNAKANGGGGTSEKICVLNQECLSPPDADICGEDNNAPGSADHHVNYMDLTGSTQANAGEGSCPKATKGNDNAQNSKFVLKPCMQRKLFKTPGSVSYKRLLPFLMDIAKGAPKLQHHHKDERGMFAERSHLPWLYQGQGAPIDELKTDNCHMHDNVDESNAIEDNILVDPANELSYGNQPEQTSSQVLPELPMQSNPKEVVQECVSTPSVTRDGSESKTTLVLNPCQQIELLKHSGSFSYRRLLPFLKNITKDNSSDDRNPTLEKGLTQTTPPPISALDYRSGCVVHMEHGTSNSTQQKVLPGPDDSLNNSSPELISSAHIPEAQSSQDSCKLIQLKDERVLFNVDSNLESSPHLPTSVVGIDSPITPASPIINEVITREEDATSASHQSSDYSEVKRHSSSNGEMPLNTQRRCQKLFQTKASEQLTIPAFGYKKGILKRNPRGCRGLCTCLNCASFRLHAERAFEFSRNQLLDAEEVALDLMKELCHLRNMLERSTNGANNQSVLDQNQVKEACRKACAAEKLAKDRVSQMKDDLNIHCRITCSQQPRVRFANYVEEKVISPGRLFSQK